MYDLKLEKYILGSVLVYPERMTETLADIKPEMFYNEEHAELFKIFLHLRSKKINPDMMTVYTFITKTDKLKSVGGAHVLSELTSNIGTDSYFNEKKIMFIDLFIRRNLFNMYQKQIQFIADPNNDYYSSYEEIKGFIENIVTTQQTETFHISDVMEKRYDEIINIKEGKIGIDTGIYPLTKNTGGWQKGDFVILAANPSMGKTAISLYFANIATDLGANILFFSLEMSKEKISDRLFSLKTGINSSNIQTNNLKTHEYDMMEEAIIGYQKGNFYINDISGKTIEKIRLDAKKHKRKHDLDMIVIDHIQHVKFSLKGGNSNSQVTHISKEIKALAKEMNVPVVALSQLSRDNAKHGRPPVLSDLRDSGSLEQDADIVLMVHRYDYMNQECLPEQENLIELYNLKNRNGEIGLYSIYRNANWSKFSEQSQMPDF